MTDAHPLHTIQNERLIIFILALLQFLHILDFVIMMPLGPLFMSDFKITSTQFGLLVSAYTVSAGVFGFIGAFYLDRFDRKSVLLFITTGFALGTLLCAISPNYFFLLIARSVAGGFGGIIGAIVLSIIGDIIPVFRRGAATGMIMSAFSVASVVGIPIGLAVASKYGWQSPFFGISFFCFAFIPFAYKVLPNIRIHLDEKDSTDGKWDAIRQVFSRKSHYYAFAYMVSLMFGGFTVIPFLSTFLVSNAGMRVDELWYIYFVGGLFTFFTSRAIGRLSDHFGKKKIYKIFALFSIIPVTLITNLGITPTVVVVALTTLFMIVVSGRMVPAFALITSAVEPKIRGSFMSINVSVQQIASGAASLISGFILMENADGKVVNFPYVGLVSITALLISIYLCSKIDQPEGSK